MLQAALANFIVVLVSNEYTIYICKVCQVSIIIALFLPFLLWFLLSPSYPIGELLTLQPRGLTNETVKVRSVGYSLTNVYKISIIMPFFQFFLNISYFLIHQKRKEKINKRTFLIRFLFHFPQICYVIIALPCRSKYSISNRGCNLWKTEHLHHENLFMCSIWRTEYGE